MGPVLMVMIEFAYFLSADIHNILLLIYTNHIPIKASL